MSLTIIHIVAGLLAIGAGFVALSTRKGGSVHRRYGKVFVGAMMVMASLGVTIAAIYVANDKQPRIQMLNVMAGTVTLYLVVTAFLTVRRRDEGFHWIDAALMVLALSVGLYFIKFGFDNMYDAKGAFFWFPAVPSWTFGTVAVLGAIGDIRMILNRGIQGPARSYLVRTWWTSRAGARPAFRPTR